MQGAGWEFSGRAHHHHGLTMTSPVGPRNNISRWLSISPQDSLLARKICLKLARILFTIQPDPDQKANGYGYTAPDSTNNAGHAKSWIEVQLLAVRPRQCGCIGTCIRDDAIQKHAFGRAH